MDRCQMTDLQVTQPTVIVDIQVSTGPDIQIEVLAPPVIYVQERGVQGPPGLGAEQTVLAAEALGGHRVVTSAGLHVTPATLDLVFGVTLGAALIGTQATIITEGPLTELSWAWLPGLAVYAGDAGLLTQSEPVGAVKRIGTAITATQIAVAIQPTIYRG
jgi:hypothetical protein